MELRSVLDSLYSGSADIPASVPRVSNPADFASVYGPVADRISQQIGVDPKIILGQLGLETGWGKSIIPGTNNLGNIKDFSGSGVGATDNMTGSRDKYRSYATPDAFATDFASLIQRKYPGAVGAGSDVSRFTAGLKGYAEDPRYSDKVAAAAQIVGRAPGPVMNAMGKAVSGLIPSASAQQKAPMNEELSQEWDAVDKKYQTQRSTAAPAAPDNEWDAIDAQYRRAPVTAKASPQPTPAPAESSGTVGQVAQQLTNITPAGFLLNAARGSGWERDVLKGGVSGFADVGNTLINGAGRLADAVGLGVKDPAQSPLGRMGITPPLGSNEARQAGLADFNRSNDSLPFNLGRFGGNVAATAPVGGLLGAGAKAAATLPMLARAAPSLNALGSSIASGGMLTGLAPTGVMGAVANTGLRVAGGAIMGGASAALIDPDSAPLGAVVGGALPPVVAGGGKLMGIAGNAIRKMRTPEEARTAQAILDVGGIDTPEKVAAVRAALEQRGPRVISEGPTVPEILQDPGISQLARTMRDSGDRTAILKEGLQNASRLGALDSVSPVTGTVQQAAENFGNGLAASARPAEALATKRVNAAFDAVDPFNETRINLPIDAMQAAKDKFLGPGTFSMGGKADAALAEARRIGTETLPAVKAATGTGNEIDLVGAVKRAGGINPNSISGRGLAGELKDLRQSGLGRVVSNQGQSVDKLAQQMHAAGYLDDADPVTLLNALRSGDRIMAPSADTGRMFQSGMEAAMGDAPAAKVLPKPVAFREIQNMRSALGEAAQQASDKGANREAAALRQMVADLDAKTQQVASGKGAQGEYFPSDIVTSWKEAVKLHADKADKFNTGPQEAMFRRGGDGLPAAQGAELAPKFFSSRGSQVADVAAFKKIADPEAMALLKNYAITDAAGQTDRLGSLTNAKFAKWVKTRSGSIEGLFTAQERAQINAVAADLQRSDAAASLGVSRGSPTYQNIQAATGAGLLDNRAVDFAARRIPVIGQFTGPILDGMRESAKRAKVQRIGGLLSDPDEMVKGIDALQRFSQSRQPIGLLSPGLLDPTLLRGAAVAPAGSGR